MNKKHIKKSYNHLVGYALGNSKNVLKVGDSFWSRNGSTFICSTLETAKTVQVNSWKDKSKRSPKWDTIYRVEAFGIEYESVEDGVLFIPRASDLKVCEILSPEQEKEFIDPHTILGTLDQRGQRR